MTRTLPVLGLLLLSACAGAPDEGSMFPDLGDFQRWEDADKYDGMYVAVEGTFDRRDWWTGVVRTRNGLEINLPNFDLFARGRSWFNYVGKQVRAEGVMHSYQRDVEGYELPTLDIKKFRVLE